MRKNNLQYSDVFTDWFNGIFSWALAEPGFLSNVTVAGYGLKKRKQRYPV